MPWVFPDEAYHMNTRGMRPLKALPIKDDFEMLPGGGSEAQSLFDSHDRRVALERVRITKKKEQGMLGHLNTTARSQRYDRSASRSAVPNGVFEGSPMDYLTSGSLRGGVISTREGQQWLQQRLKQRITEYDELASGNFAGGPPQHIDVSPFNNLDTLVQVAFTSFTSQTFSSGLNDTLNQLLQALIKAGSTITGRELSRYAQAIGTMVQIVRANETFKVTTSEGFDVATMKQYGNLTAIDKTLRLIDAAIREIARVIDEPVAARQQVMSTLGSRLLGSQLETFVADASTTGPKPVEFGNPPDVSRDLLSPEQYYGVEEEVIEAPGQSLPVELAGYPAAFEAERLTAPPRTPTIPPMVVRSPPSGQGRLPRMPRF
jgi:hypothetical protein